MTIETKYNVGDEVFFIDGKVPCKAKITSIQIFTGHLALFDAVENKVDLNKVRIQYFFSENSGKSEKYVYGSKEEMIKDLFEKL